MGAPKFKPYPKEKSQGKGKKTNTDSNNDKEAIRRLQEKIKNKLLEPGMAKKAAQIISELLEQKKKK